LFKAMKWASAVILIVMLTGCAVAGASAKIAPQIDLFSVNPQAVQAGQSALISWSVTDNSSTVTIEPGIGVVPAKGSVAVRPDRRQQYTIIAANSYGKVSSTLDIDVIPAPGEKTQMLPVINSFKAQPEHGYAGSMFEISWDVEDADTVTIAWNDKGNVVSTDNEGSIVQQPVVSTTYILMAKNRQGVRAINLTITVDRDPAGMGGADSAGCG
jgi:hypothetical protein